MTSDATTSTASNFRRDVLVALALAAVTLVVFAPVRHFDFIVFDDPGYVYRNARTLAGLSWDNVRWAFTAVRIGNWHPITWLSHMLDVQLFGLNAGAHHLHNAVIHAINVVLVYAVLVRLSGAATKSAIVAALFAIHPLRMESVAWISERKDVLCTTFFLLTIWTYAHYAARKSPRWYVATALLFALGLMTKPMIVTLPAVLLLLDFWPLRRRERWTKLVLEKLPLFALSIASSIVTYYAQRLGGAMMPEHYPLPLRLGNAIWAYGRYLRKSFWPDDLAIYYPYYGAIEGTTLPWTKVIVSAIFLVLISGIAVWLWRRRNVRAVLVGWLWFLGTAVPTIGIVQVGSQSMADRYTYIPQIGLFIALIWGVGDVTERRPALRPLMLGSAAVGIVALAAVTVRQLPYWANNVTLFSHALEVTDHNAMAHGCLGMALTEMHRNDEARPHYAAALAITPMDSQINNNYGNLLFQEGRKQEALKHLDYVVRAAPRFAEGHNNRANVLADLNRTDEALAEHEQAIHLDPDLAQAHYNYGVTLARAGRLREAQAQLERALQLRSEYADARYTYGVVMAGLSYELAAAAQLREANFLRRDWYDALRSLAWLLATSPEIKVRNGAQAVVVAERANQLTGYENPIALDTLAAAYAEAGRFDSAVATETRAQEIARAGGKSDLADRFAARLELYRANKPFHRVLGATTQPFDS